MEIISAIAISLFLIPVIIGSVVLALKLLGQILHVDINAYIDEETEGYINGPNRWD